MGEDDDDDDDDGEHGTVTPRPAGPTAADYEAEIKMHICMVYSSESPLLSFPINIVVLDL